MHFKDGTTGGLKELACCRRVLGAWQQTKEQGWRLSKSKECYPDLAPILIKP